MPVEPEDWCFCADYSKRLIAGMGLDKFFRCGRVALWVCLYRFERQTSSHGWDNTFVCCFADVGLLDCTPATLYMPG